MEEVKLVKWNITIVNIFLCIDSGIVLRRTKSLDVSTSSATSTAASENDLHLNDVERVSNNSEEMITAFRGEDSKVCSFLTLFGNIFDNILLTGNRRRQLCLGVDQGSPSPQE